MCVYSCITEHKRKYNFLLALMLIVVIIQLKYTIEVEIFDKFKNIIDTLNPCRNIFVCDGNTDLKVFSLLLHRECFSRQCIMFFCLQLQSLVIQITLQKNKIIKDILQHKLYFMDHKTFCPWKILNKILLHPIV